MANHRGSVEYQWQSPGWFAIDNGASSAREPWRCDAQASASVTGHRVLLGDAAATRLRKGPEMQHRAIAGFHTRLAGTSDESRLTGCDVCVIADRFGAQAGEWRGDDGLSMLTRIVPCLADAPLVFAGASQLELLSRAAGEARVRRDRLIGSPRSPLIAITAIVRWKPLLAIERSC